MRTHLRATAAVLGVVLSLPAQNPLQATPPQPALSLAGPTHRVSIDRPGDGLLWAHGDDWKASFGPAGSTFVPFLGSEAPRNFPLTLQLVSVRCGGNELVGADAVAPRTEGDRRLVLERGGVTELWELAPRSIEQKFVFRQRPGAGPCAVTQRVTSELAGVAAVDGSLTFANELGGVRIGKATAVDARGATTPATTTFAGGAITWTVPADFVARATFPLVLDPVVSTHSLVLPPNGLQQLNADVAYVAGFGGVFAAVCEEIFSATDHDVRIHAYDRLGHLLLADYVDFTNQSWRQPKVASHTAANQFLCVAERGADIGGRLVGLAMPQTTLAYAFDVQRTIYQAGVGSAILPDVGGNPSTTAALPGAYCVTWEHNTVRRAMVGTNGVVGPASVVGLPLAVGRFRPSVSKSCSPETNVQQWILVWEQSNGADRDIHGALIDTAGNAVVTDFLISGSSFVDTYPQVSSKTDFVAGVDHWMVVWQRAIPGSVIAVAHDDVYGAVFQDTTNLTGETNLTQLLNRPNFANQVHPCVDTDGTRFAVGFSEQASVFTNDWQPYLATVHLTPSAQLGVSAYPELLNGYVEVDDDLQITSEHSGGTYTTRYVATWTASGGFGSSGLAAFYRGHLNLPAASYFNHALQGCGAMQLVANGLPALGETMFLDLVNVQGFPLFAVGQSVPPFALCSNCALGVDAATMTLLPQASIAYTVPPDVTLLGAQLAVQGIDVFAPNGCPQSLFGFEFTLTDEIVVTIL